MCERLAEDVGIASFPIHLSPLTEEATDAFQFMPKNNILILCEQFKTLKHSLNQCE